MTRRSKITMNYGMFENRKEAGRLLAEAVRKSDVFPLQNGIVLALPRGGVVVGAEIAKSLGVPLDIVVTRKIGAPFNPEVAIGAVSQDGSVYWNERFLAEVSVSNDYKVSETERQLREIRRRLLLYRGNRPSLTVDGRDVLIVDDGIATGYTLKAAIMDLKKGKSRRIHLAVPVAPLEVKKELESLVSSFICLFTPENFWAVGQFYRDFGEVSDETVIEILNELADERV